MGKTVWLYITVKPSLDPFSFPICKLKRGKHSNKDHWAHLNGVLTLVKELGCTNQNI